MNIRDAIARLHGAVPKVGLLAVLSTMAVAGCVTGPAAYASVPATGRVAEPAEPAEIVLLNGAVYTADAARSWAAAVAIAHGRIAFVGSDAAARAYVGPATRVIDLKGRMLLPGFQDSHVHPSLAPNPATWLDVGGIPTRTAILERVGDFARSHPAKPWVVGTGWQESAFLPSGQPDRAMLDGVVGDRPAFLTNNSQHMAWVSSAALRAAGIDEHTPDPANGRIERDGSGRPTGVLQEAAMELVRRAIPPLTSAEMAEDLAASLREMQRLGVTALEDASVRPATADAYAVLVKAGRVDMRAHLCQYFDPTLQPALTDDAQVAQMIARRESFAGTLVAADCVKIVLDGAYGSHTVALLEPYSDEPAKFGLGKLFVEPDRLQALVTRLDKEGFQVHVHAIGDRAVRTALDAFAAARRANGARDSHHTLAHLALIADSDIARFRSLGVVANMTPLWNRGDPWEAVFAPKLFGPLRAANLYRTRTLLDAGVVLAWGTDWPVTGVDPLDGIETAVTRRYPGGRDPEGKEDKAWLPEQRVTLPEAITAYTAAGAYLVREDGQRGTVTPGKLADLVVLSRNLFEVAPLEIHAVDVDMTIFDGRIVFERQPAGR